MGVLIHATGRGMVQMLREHDGVELAPMPTVTDCDGLARGSHDCLTVDVAVFGGLTDLSDPVGTTVYRLVQAPASGSASPPTPRRRRPRTRRVGHACCIAGRHL